MGRAEVAATVNRVSVPPCSCVVQSIITAKVLEAIGLPNVRLGMGGLIYRCGPAITDTMTYCNLRGYGFYDQETNTLFGHAYALYGRNTLVDCSLHDLHHDLTFLKETTPGEYTQTWVIAPPAYFWDDASLIRHHGPLTRFPKPGEFIVTDYHSAAPPWAFLRPDEQAFAQQVLEELTPDVAELRRRFIEGDLLL
jgi:hypothetical protein